MPASIYVTDICAIALGDHRETEPLKMEELQETVRSLMWVLGT